ncbi:hypothetical protein Tco_0667088 [Tanacetum coccineum]
MEQEDEVNTPDVEIQASDYHSFLNHACMHEVNIEKEQLMRFIVMGQKTDPTSKKKGRPYWGFVEMVTTNIQDIKDALKGEEYETKTRGHRHKLPARALGEGNPTQKGRNEFRGLKRKRKPVFPKHLQERFGKLRLPMLADPTRFPNYKVSDETRTIGSDTMHKPSARALGEGKVKQQNSSLRRAVWNTALPDFLNYQGCEFLMISASDNIHEELGVDVHEDSSCSDLINTFGTETLTDALVKGIWV